MTDTIRTTTILTDGSSAFMWINSEFIIVRIHNEIGYVHCMRRWLSVDQITRLTTALIEASAI
jgi:hypothetical protein